MKGFIKKNDTHTIIKNEEIEKYAGETGQKVLYTLLEIIGRGRCEDGKYPFNKYYICNTDEPYADEVFEVIKKGEIDKSIDN